MELQPLFFKLFSYRGALDSQSSSLRQDWMNLAGQFMFQTAIEQLLVHGTKDADVLKEISAWSWKEDRHVDEMFADSSPKDSSEWEKIRSSWAGLLKPSSKSTSLVHHLLQAADAYPLLKFEQCMMGFLATLHGRISPPLLSQLEEGQVEGLPMSQCQEVLRRWQAVA